MSKICLIVSVTALIVIVCMLCVDKHSTKAIIFIIWLFALGLTNDYIQSKRQNNE